MLPPLEATRVEHRGDTVPPDPRSLAFPPPPRIMFSARMLVSPLYINCQYIHPTAVSCSGTLEDALQLLSKRHKLIRFAHVHERVSLLRSVEPLSAVTSGLPMKPGITRNTRLTS